jgi:hypothetical protein
MRFFSNPHINLRPYFKATDKKAQRIIQIASACIGFNQCLCGDVI